MSETLVVCCATKMETLSHCHMITNHISSKNGRGSRGQVRYGATAQSKACTVMIYATLGSICWSTSEQHCGKQNISKLCD